MEYSDQILLVNTREETIMAVVWNDWEYSAGGGFLYSDDIAGNEGSNRQSSCR